MSAESVTHQIDGQSGKFKGQRKGEKKLITGYGRKAKRLVLSKIKKAKNRLMRNKAKGNESRCWGRIPSTDSAVESPTSDPNSSGFGLDSLKGLIEKSDFLLDDCNTHLDVYTSSHNHVVDYETDDD